MARIENSNSPWWSRWMQMCNCELFTHIAPFLIGLINLRRCFRLFCMFMSLFIPLSALSPCFQLPLENEASWRQTWLVCFLLTSRLWQQSKQKKKPIVSKLVASIFEPDEGDDSQLYPGEWAKELCQLRLVNWELRREVYIERFYWVSFVQLSIETERRIRIFCCTGFSPILRGAPRKMLAQ